MSKFAALLLVLLVPLTSCGSYLLGAPPTPIPPPTPTPSPVWERTVVSLPQRAFLLGGDVVFYRGFDQLSELLKQGWEVEQVQTPTSRGGDYLYILRRDKASTPKWVRIARFDDTLDSDIRQGWEIERSDVLRRYDDTFLGSVVELPNRLHILRYPIDKLK